MPDVPAALLGERITSWRWEVLAHAGGSDHLLGYLDGVVSDSASLEWSTNVAVKGKGRLDIEDLAVARDGYMTMSQVIAAVGLLQARLRPVLVIQGAAEYPQSVFLFDTAPENWTATGRTYSVSLRDRGSVLAQDAFDATYTIDAATPALSAIASVVASAGESIAVDGSDARLLASPMSWSADDELVTKLSIVNDVLSALGYLSLRVDPRGDFRAIPYVSPANRPIVFDLVDGESAIYLSDWSYDHDFADIPNKVIAIEAASGDAEALIGVWTNTDPASPFSYTSPPVAGTRGEQWVVRRLRDVQTPAGDVPERTAFLEAKARQSGLAASAVQAELEIECLPITVEVNDVVRFRSNRAGIDGRYVVVYKHIAAHALGLMRIRLQEVIDL